MVKWNDRYPSLANLNEVEDVNPLRRAYSENHLGSTVVDDEQPSVLSVNTNRTNVGEKIVISWNLNLAPSQEDWLGLFYADGKFYFNNIFYANKICHPDDTSFCHAQFGILTIQGKTMTQI